VKEYRSIQAVAAPIKKDAHRATKKTAIGNELSLIANPFE